MTARILIVEDEPDVRSVIRRALGHHGFETKESGNVRQAVELLAAYRPELVLVDHRLPDGTAFEVIDALAAAEIECPIIVMTAFGSIDLAVEAMRRGAENFVTKPIDLEALSMLVERALDGSRRRRREAAIQATTARNAGSLDPFTGTSAAIREVRRLAEAVVASEAPVLITGETGTGKGILARWLHEQGPRTAQPFVDLNCSGLSRELAESELFGHQRGSFTSATSNKPGLVEIAHRGTLFLDEIGDLDATVQPKLLKILEEQTYRKVGDVKPRRVDLRLVAATHRNLGAMTVSGEFRSDLLFRINTITFRLPALRDRAEDIPELARRVLAASSPAHSLDASALAALCAHDWPGNIRELRNVLERAVLLSRSNVIGAELLHFDQTAGTASRRPSEPEGLRSETLEDVERQHIMSVLKAAEGHVERAAARLGVPRSSLYAKLKRFGIHHV